MSALEKPLHIDISVRLPLTYSHRLMAQEPIRTQSGTVRIVDSSNCPAAKMIAGGLIEIEPDGMRELHWQSNSDELQYYIEGKARMTVSASGSDEHTFHYQGGDVGCVRKGMPHYIENTGVTRLRYLELWQSDRFADVSLAQWLAFTPYELVKAHLNIDRSVLAGVSTVVEAEAGQWQWTYSFGYRPWQGGSAQQSA